MKKVQKASYGDLRVVTDRVKLLAWPSGGNIPEVSGFTVRQNMFIKPQTAQRTYGRVCMLEQAQTGTQLFAQYRPSMPSLPPVKITVVPDDHKGLDRKELCAVAQAFERVRLHLVEVSLDFTPASGVDRSFVLRHGRFGKCRCATHRLFSDLRFGGRHSAKLIRGYSKPEINAYRVELELHSDYLRGHGLVDVRDLPKLAELIIPDCISFVEIRWDSVTRQLSRKKLPVDQILLEVQSRSHSLHRVLAYLRGRVGIVNVHRFLRPLPINRSITAALFAWARQWSRGDKR
jgi:hypothetical protein